jgi:hypothetical protein
MLEKSNILSWERERRTRFLFFSFTGRKKNNHMLVVIVVFATGPALANLSINIDSVTSG